MAKSSGSERKNHRTTSVSDSTVKINYPELFFGFVAPIGADIRVQLEAIRTYLESHAYQVIEIKVYVWGHHSRGKRYSPSDG
jgi:hypothetical protein